MKLAPNDANIWNGLGWASLNIGKVEQAESAFQKVIALVPDHPAALNGLGQIYLSRREYDKAEPPLLQAAKQGASAAWFGLARLYLLQGKFEDAQKWAQMLIDSKQGDAISVKMLEAAKAKSLSDELRQTIEPPPANPETR
ncbi:MAG: tetratricopeptide repeat protein [Chthoniobacter sp.]|nr:tetratricopeptide repeat protein [Chthoniobacter sp.]